MIKIKIINKLRQMKTKLLTSCQNNASINFSMINQFKPAYIYRFYCLSLRRDEWYNVKITLDELKTMTGDRSVSGFNDKFREFLDIKSYYVDNGFAYKTRRNVYHIPPMETECITLSNKFVIIDLEAAVKGFWIQLILLSKYANIELTKASIIKTLGMDRKTYDKYVNELLNNKLVSCNEGKLILHTDGILLENDYKRQKKLSKRERGCNELPNITLSSSNNK